MKSFHLRAGLSIILLQLGVGCASMPAPSFPPFTTNSKINAQMAVAKLQEQQGDLASAKSVYDSVLKKRPKHAEAHQRLAIVAVRQGKTELAEEHFAKARQLDPNNLRLMNDLGYFYYLENRLPEAEEVLREVIDEDPLNPRALNNLGLVLGFQNRYDEAIEVFRRVGTDAEAHANIAFVYAQVGDLDRAQAHYSLALTHNPGMKPAAQALLEIARRAPRPRVPANQPGPFNPADAGEHLAAQPGGAPNPGGFHPGQPPLQPPPQFAGPLPSVHDPRQPERPDLAGVQPASHNAQVAYGSPDGQPGNHNTAYYTQPLNNQQSVAAPIPTAVYPGGVATPGPATFHHGANASPAERVTHSLHDPAQPLMPTGQYGTR